MYTNWWVAQIIDLKHLPLRRLGEWCLSRNVSLWGLVEGGASPPPLFLPVNSWSNQNAASRHGTGNSWQRSNGIHRLVCHSLQRQTLESYLFEVVSRALESQRQVSRSNVTTTAGRSDFPPDFSVQQRLGRLIPTPASKSVTRRTHFYRLELPEIFTCLLIQGSGEKLLRF